MHLLNLIFFFTHYCNFFLKRSIFKFDVFFHISPSFTKWLNRYSNFTKSTFIPPGFNSIRFPDFEPKPKNNDIIKLVFIGALQYQLDLLPLIKALHKNINYELTIIGENGTGHRYKECHSYIIKNNIDNVKIIGVIDSSLVSRELRKYDIGVIPMISNSITNKFFDYVASYLPIIVLGDNDSSELVLKNDIGWSVDFCPKNISKLLLSINLNAINKRISNIRKIRKKYDRNILYNKIPNLIAKN